MLCKNWCPETLHSMTWLHLQTFACVHSVFKQLKVDKIQFSGRRGAGVIEFKRLYPLARGRDDRSCEGYYCL
jgi:hypothetical protein